VVLHQEEGHSKEEAEENAGVSVKIIFLDTRSFRDDHWIKSLGSVRFPFSALVASAIRALQVS